MLKSLALLSSALLLASCFHDHPATDFLDQDLSGRINGKEWQYKHAYVDPTIDTPEEEDLVFVFLSYVPKKPCTKLDQVKELDPRSVMVSAPKAKKQVKLKSGSTRNLVFHFDKNGEPVATVAKAGKIKISEISDSVVKGKVFAQYNNGNWVSGNFSAIICDYRDLQ